MIRLAWFRHDRWRKEKREDLKNGFTLLQSLLVLLLTGVMMIPALNVSRSPSLSVFMETLSLRLVMEQSESFIYKEVRKVQIERTKLIASDQTFEFPRGIACEPYTLYWNENGNPGRAGTIRCHTNKETWKLVVGLGSGRIHYEKES